MTGALLIARFVLLVPLLLLRSWVIVLLWGWFVTPLGVDELTLAHAIGISALMSLFMAINKPSEDEDEVERFVWDTSVAILLPLIALGVGAVAHGAMP